MATNDLTNKYFIKNTLAGTYVDFATLFDGLRILRIDGFLAQGQSKNVYTASWEYEDEEDFAIVMQDDSDAPRIIHESADINITFIIRQKYATGAIDVHTQHKKFIEYMTEKDVWIKNSYNNNLVAHCVCLKEYSPTTEKYQRGSDSWVMGTITLHKLTSKLYHEFALTTSLIGCTSDLPPVITNEKLFATIIPLAGHQQLPWNTKVTMEGVDITSSVYDKSTGTISISSVTGDITIEAEAVMMSSEYEPVEYISSLHNTGNASQGFNLGIYPTEKTQIKLVMEQVINEGRYIVNLYREDSGWGYRNRSSSVGTQCYFYWCGKSSGNRDYQLETDVKATITCDKGAWKVEHENGYNYGYTFNSEGVEYTASKALYLMGNGYSANNPTGRIYRFTHCEDDVLQDDYIPAKNIATGQFGLYKLISGTFLSKSNALWLGKVVLTDRTLVNCSISRLSTADTGTTIFAAVGETWQIKITPSSGYTFVGGTTPQVLIDGIDVTSQVVTDNGDGTYNVTIANVEDKPIEITAVAVSDGTANSTNSVTPMGGNTENNEEEM